MTNCVVCFFTVSSCKRRKKVGSKNKYDQKKKEGSKTRLSDLHNNITNQQEQHPITTIKKGKGELTSVTYEGVACLQEDALIRVHHARLHPDVPKLKKAPQMIVVVHIHYLCLFPVDSKCLLGRMLRHCRLGQVTTCQCPPVFLDSVVQDPDGLSIIHF